MLENVFSVGEYNIYELPVTQSVSLVTSTIGQEGCCRFLRIYTESGWLEKYHSKSFFKND